MVVELVGN